MDENAIERMIGLGEILKMRAKVHPKYEKHMFLILDDLMYDSRNMKNSSMQKILMNGRHQNITFFSTAQYLMKISKESRSQIGYVFVFKCNDSTIIDQVHDNFCPILGKQEFRDLFYQITGNYRAMVIKIDNSSDSLDPIDYIFYYHAKSPDAIPPFSLVCRDLRTLHRKYGLSEKELEHRKVREFQNKIYTGRRLSKNSYKSLNVELEGQRKGKPKYKPRQIEIRTNGRKRQKAKSVIIDLG